MKKLSWVIALILAFTMALSLAACGSDGESDGQDDTPEENVEQETPEDGGNESETTDPSDVTEEPEQSGDQGTELEMDPSQLPESGTFASLEEYVEFAGLDEEGAAGEGITVLVEDGNKLVYEYVYDIPSDQTEMYQETLAAAMDSMADTFTSLIGVIDDVVDVEGLTLVVRYVNSDGSVIYSQEYTAE